MTRFARAGIRVRLLLLILVALLPVFGLRLYSAIDDRRAAARDAEANAYDVARLVAQDQQGLFEQSRQQLFTFAQLVALSSGQPIDARTCRPALLKFMQRLPDYVDLGIVAPSGGVLCAATTKAGIDLSHESFVAEALKSRRFAIGDYEVRQSTGKSTISLAYPVVVKGRVSSIMFATLDLAALNRRAAGTPLGRGWVLNIVDGRGTILVRQPDSDRWVGRRVRESPLIQAARTRGRGGIEDRGIDGVTRFYGFTRLFARDAGSLTVTVGMPKSVALAASNHKLKRDFIVLGLVALGALLIAWLSGRFFFIRPLETLTRTAHRLRAGDLNARTGLSRRGGEIGELARTMDEMAESLEVREHEISRLNQDLERRVVERTAELEAAGDELESQNAELELQTAELEDQQTRLGMANDELEAQRAELERTLEELANEKERVELMYSFGEMLARETERGELAINVMRELGDLAEAEVGVIYVAALEHEDQLVLAATRGLEHAALPDRITSGKGLAGRAVAERRPIVVARGDRTLRVESFGQEVEIGHELHLPLSFGGRVLGVVSLGRLGDRRFSEDQLETLEHLAGEIAVAVSNKLAFREALRLGDINRAVLDATLDGILLADENGEVVLMNSTQQRLLTELFDLPPGGTVPEYQEILAERVTEPERFRTAAAQIASDPEFEGLDNFDLLSGRSYLRYTAPVRNAAGDLIGRVFVMRDTTTERQAERLKTELVATVSHELRTPLASIMGFAELLSHRDYDDETRDRFLGTIHGEATRLTGLVNEFLDLQRIEAGRFTLTLEPFELDALVREEVELYSAQSGSHRLEVKLPDEPVQVLGERERIAQVLGNLLSNAIKYSPRGGQIDVLLELNGSSARISVSDDGVGIPEPQQGHVFSKFFRADSSDTREIGGTGLGLALCKEIVEAHAGHIGFTSVEGRGSTFWFDLPTPSSSNGHRNGRPSVLVVEDDPGAASLLSRYLTEADYTVAVLPTGEQALAHVSHSPPDAICLDITLAGLVDGWTVLSRLKEDPALSGIPVVICTAGNGRTTASALGASDFLSKPFSGSELRAVLGRVLPEGRGSVLVVDDEESVRSLVVETLSETGYELREAADGEEALDRVAARRPSAIVLDLMLPKLDGFEVLERLQRDPATRDIPVIVLTARTLSSQDRASLQRRAVRVMEKNEYSGDELRALVARSLG